MATKKQIAERALRILQGGDLNIDSDIDIREVMLHVDSERDNLIQQKLVENYKPRKSVAAVTAHEILGNYISEHTISTSFDSTRSQRYAMLGQIPMDLPDNAGLLYVNNAEDFSISFAKMSPGLERTFVGLPSLAASKKSYYTQVGKKIFFDEDSAPTSVIVGMVAVSSSLSDTELYPVSPGDVSTIIKSIVDLYKIMVQVEQDNITDNIDQ
jgi:hypothetical protein